MVCEVFNVVLIELLYTGFHTRKPLICIINALVRFSQSLIHCVNHFNDSLIHPVLEAFKCVKEHLTLLVDSLVCLVSSLLQPTGAIEQDSNLPDETDDDKKYQDTM